MHAADLHLREEQIYTDTECKSIQSEEQLNRTAKCNQTFIQAMVPR